MVLAEVKAEASRLYETTFVHEIDSLIRKLIDWHMHDRFGSSCLLMFFVSMTICYEKFL